MRDKLRAVPGAAWVLGLLAGFAAYDQVWDLVLIIVGVPGAFLLGQWRMRRRGRRLCAEAAARGGGVWLGRVPTDQAESLWRARLPRVLASMYVRDGYPVRVTADLSGLVVAPRGPLLTRLRRLSPALIPWSDLAGARARRMGFTTGSGTLWMLPMTAVTLDLVGASAQGHLPPPTPEETRKALRRLGIDPDALDQEEDEADDDADDAEEEAFLREINGPDWRPGTEPLHLTTNQPDGLVALVTGRASGRPASASPRTRNPGP